MLMNTSTRLAQLVKQLAPAARGRFPSESAWAAASGVPKETLSRLKRNPSCDFRTIAALADTAGCTLVAVPMGGDQGGSHMPERLSREYESALLDLCASGNVDRAVWLAHGASFFMGGLAVLVAGARGFEREKYLRLAEELHPGISVPEVFSRWLAQSPVRAARFLPMARHRKLGA